LRFERLGRDSLPYAWVRNIRSSCIRVTSTNQEGFLDRLDLVGSPAAVDHLADPVDSFVAVDPLVLVALEHAGTVHMLHILWKPN
jgi:hypothetical protein